MKSPVSSGVQNSICAENEIDKVYANLKKQEQNCNYFICIFTFYSEINICLNNFQGDRCWFKAKHFLIIKKLDKITRWVSH